MVDPFIALLKVTVTTALGQEPAAALVGPSETAVGAIFEAGLPEPLHPALKPQISSREARKNILVLISIWISGLLFPRTTIMASPPRLNLRLCRSSLVCAGV